MTIGVICAMQEEINEIHKDMQSDRTTTIAGRDFISGTLYGQNTILVMSRIGKVAAAVTAALLLEHFKVDKILICGTAGGVDPQMNVGDIVVADYSVQHDMNPGDNSFRIPLLDVDYLKSDEALTSLALQAVSEYASAQMTRDIPQEYLDKFHISAPKAVLGTIASGDQFICEKEKNTWLYEHVKNIKCVEMEGAAVAQVCYEWGVPFTVIRVISDGANDDSSVDFDLFIEKAARFFTRGIVRACFERMA